jgi:hypothetical protein
VSGQAHGGQSQMLKQCKYKAMDFEKTHGLGTGEEAWGAEPLEQQVQWSRTQGASMLQKGQGVLTPGVKSLAGSRHGGHYLG